MQNDKAQASNIKSSGQFKSGGVYEQAKHKEAAVVTKKVRNDEGEKVGRNDPCPCGSGKKYKTCCG